MLVGAFSLEQLCVVLSGSVQPTAGPWGATGGHRGPALWPRWASVFGVRETAADREQNEFVCFFLRNSAGSCESHSGSRDVVYLCRASPVGMHVGLDGLIAMAMLG